MTPVCLPAPSYSPAPDSLAKVTGFGTTSETSSEPSARLLGVDVRIIPLAQCAASNQVIMTVIMIVVIMMIMTRCTVPSWCPPCCALGPGLEARTPASGTQAGLWFR